VITVQRKQTSLYTKSALVNLTVIKIIHYLDALIQVILDNLLIEDIFFTSKEFGNIPFIIKQATNATNTAIKFVHTKFV
jgi:hypothetical protein